MGITNSLEEDEQRDVQQVVKQVLHPVEKFLGKQMQQLFDNQDLVLRIACYLTWQQICKFFSLHSQFFNLFSSAKFWNFLAGAHFEDAHQPVENCLPRRMFVDGLDLVLANSKFLRRDFVTLRE